jgi:hypothetical protein
VTRFSQATRLGDHLNRRPVSSRVKPGLASPLPSFGLERQPTFSSSVFLAPRIPSHCFPIPCSQAALSSTLQRRELTKGKIVSQLSATDWAKRFIGSSISATRDSARHFGPTRVHRYYLLTGCSDIFEWQANEPPSFVARTLADRTFSPSP